MGNLAKFLFLESLVANFFSPNEPGGAIRSFSYCTDWIFHGFMVTYMVAMRFSVAVCFCFSLNMLNCFRELCWEDALFAPLLMP